MRDSQAVFTGVGVIATLLAFLFAFAAFYAQSRRRAERQRLARRDETPPRPVGVPVTPPAEIEEHPGIAASETQAEPAPGPEGAADGSALFKKYTIQSMSVGPSTQEKREEYQWD